METKLLNPLTLAFMGDGIYELMAREYITTKYGSLPPSKLHKYTVEMVRASAQAKAYDLIKSTLSEQEENYFKRGRNSSSVTVPKSSTPVEYRCATGLETLFGWLYLEGNKDRLEELFTIIVKEVEDGKIL